MPEDWNALAAEVAADIAEDGFPSTLRKPGVGGPTSPHDATPEPSPTLHELTGIEDNKEIREQSGTVIGETRRTLYVNATGATPEEDDEIAVGVQLADVTSATVFDTIVAVRPVSPGGVALLYELDLAN